MLYVLQKKVYANETLMKNIRSIKRFIDDGAGLFNGTLRQFQTWIKSVNDTIAPHGLNIDEFQVKNVTVLLTS